MDNSSVQPSPAPRRRNFQFSLRSMFIWVTFIAALLAVIVRVEPGFAFAMLVALALFAAHVMGNALGTSLRNASDESLQQEREHAASASQKQAVPSFAAHSLTERTKLGKLPIVCASLGALGGGSMGGAFVILAAGDEITSGGVALAIFSMAILGGWLGFLASSLIKTSSEAWREAAHKAPRPKAP